MTAMQRRLASIMFSDMVGYSALAQRNELLAIELLDEHRRLLRGLFAQHRGREIDAVGDGFFVEFPSAIDAVQCALDIQRALVERNAAAAKERRIEVRIGLHLGDVVVEGERVVGDGVNLAARIQALAQPGEILLSEDVARQIRNKIETPLENLGSQTLKNIVSPVQIHRLRLPWQEVAGKRSKPSPRARRSFTGSIMTGGVVALLVIAAAFYMIHTRSTPAPPTGQPRLAVLPFANMSADRDNEYFVDGMTEELISRLSRIKGIDVIARTSIMQFKGKQVSIADIGRQLNVNTVLEGSVRKAGNRLRITAQLVNVQSQTHLWSEDYDRDTKDVFAIQSDVARRVADALRVQLVPDEKQEIEKRGTQSLEAYELYLQGLYQQNAATPEGFEKSIEYFTRATEKDPKYARAFAGIANSLELVGIFGLRPQARTFAEAKAAASKALTLDETVVEAYVTLGAVKVYLDLDWAGQEQALKRALALNPKSAMVNDWYGINHLCPKGRHAEAIAHIERAMTLDPLSPLLQQDAGWTYWCAGKYHEAIGAFQSSITREPNLSFAYNGLALSLSALGRHAEAIGAALKEVELTSAASLPLGTLGYVYSRAGHEKEAREVLARLLNSPKSQEIEPLALAAVYAGLEEKDAAFAMLDRSFEARNFQRLIYINGGNYFAPIRPDPRFEALVKKLGLR
jgi:TolB-like protein/class 3 adenylate cyclase/Tfp pilus assembly protein PilF